MVKKININNSLCTGCKNCEAECSKTFFKDETGKFSVIKIAEDDSKKFEINVCSQCGKCTHICPTQALYALSSGVIALNRSKCVQCFACVGFCDTLSIHYFSGVPYPNKCVLCGKCVKKCTSGAITLS